MRGFWRDSEENYDDGGRESTAAFSTVCPDRKVREDGRASINEAEEGSHWFLIDKHSVRSPSPD